MSFSCLESQGCHLIPLSYLFCCFSAQTSCTFCPVIFPPIDDDDNDDDDNDDDDDDGNDDGIVRMVFLLLTLMGFLIKFDCILVMCRV